MHALRHVHGLVVPGGVLVDLHPVTEQVVESRRQLLGTLVEPDWKATVLPNAEACLQDAIREGYYALEDEIEYDLRQHFDSVDELLVAEADLLEGLPGLAESIRAAEPPLVLREHYVGRRLRVC